MIGFRLKRAISCSVRLVFGISAAIVGCFGAADSSLFDMINELNKINTKIIKIQDSSKKAYLTDDKLRILEEFLNSVMDAKIPVGLDIAQNLRQQDALNFLLIESTSKNQNLAINQAQLIDLKLDENLYNTLSALRKNIHFFSTKDGVINIISPHLDSIKSLQKDFQNLALPSLQDQEKYSLKFATFYEALEYLSQNAQKILPQNVFLNISVEWFLHKISLIIPQNYSSPLASKILVSIFVFIILWLCRKIIARVIVWFVDLGVRFAREDAQTQIQIQKGIIKPISWFLFVVSVNISCYILYYPAILPSGLEKWFSVIFIILFAWFMIVIFSGYGVAFITNLAQKSSNTFRKEVINLILKVVYFIIIIIAILMILKTLGFNISAIVASLGLGGLAVALAVKDMLANFFASVMLLFDNSFSQGDWIECGGVEGTIVEMGLRRTTIRTFDNGLVLIPNSELANKSITNWSRRKEGRLIKFAIGLTYDSPIGAIEKCIADIKEMLINHPNIAKDSDEKNVDYRLSLKKDIVSVDDLLGYKRSINVVLNELSDSSIDILVSCFSKKTTSIEYYKTKQEVIISIMNIVEMNNLSFAYPSQSLYLEKMPTIDSDKISIVNDGGKKNQSCD